MSSETMVFGSTSRRSELWRVYRIRTANSAYELEVQGGDDRSSRRCAVMTCVEPASRAGEVFEDSSPQLGAKSLFELSPLDWIGRRLSLGTACTSEIQSVDFITQSPTRSVPRAPRHASTTPAPPQPPPWAPYPLGSVEMVEAAASVLQAVAHQHALRRDLAHEPRHLRRLELALAQCGLLLEALGESAR